MVAFRVASVSLFLALTACSVGEVPIGGTPPTVDAPGATIDAPGGTIDAPGTAIDAAPTGNDPAATFQAIVIPIVTEDIGGRNCSMAGCHAPKANQPDLSSYAALGDKYKMKPGNTNILVTHGVHAGPALPVGDAKKIAAWIESLP